MYKKLVISKIMLVLLVMSGMIAGTLAAAGHERITYLVVVKALAATFLVPVALLGVGWFWGVGKSLFALPIKEWKNEIVRS